MMPFTCCPSVLTRGSGTAVCSVATCVWSPAGGGASQSNGEEINDTPKTEGASHRHPKGQSEPDVLTFTLMIF